MGKVKLLLDVIGDLRSLADSLQAVADAVADNGTAEEMTDAKEPEKAGRSGKAAAKNTAKKDTKAAKQEPEEKPLTLEEVRAVLAEKSRSGYTEEVRELLAWGDPTGNQGVPERPGHDKVCGKGKAGQSGRAGALPV